VSGPAQWTRAGGCRRSTGRSREEASAACRPNHPSRARADEQSRPPWRATQEEDGSSLKRGRVDLSCCFGAIGTAVRAWSPYSRDRSASSKRDSSNVSFHRLGHTSPSKGWPGVARQLDPTRESGYRWNDARDWAVPRTAAAQREVKEHWAAEVCPVTRSIPPRAKRWPSSRTGARCRRRRASSAPLRDGRVIELTKGSRLGGRRGAERPVPPR